MSDLIQLINKSLIESVKDCFSTTLSINLLEGGEVKQPNPENCMICSIGFTGKIDGSVAVIIQDTIACKIVGQMLCMEFTEVTADVKDGFGEIGNMVAGGFKNRLSNNDFKCDITVPTTIIGKNLELSFSKDVAHTAIHFSEGRVNRLLPPLCSKAACQANN